MSDDPVSSFSDVGRSLGPLPSIAAVLLGLLWLIHALSGAGDGFLAGGWWKGPILSGIGLLTLGAWWQNPGR